MRSTSDDLETAAGIAAAVQSGAVSASEMAERALAGIAERDGPVNSCVQVLEEQARREARELDDSPGPHGPLAGVPITVKEIYSLQGERVTWGVPALADVPPATADDPRVAMLRSAGAVVVARTNIPELSCWGHTENRIHGATRNPADLGMTPGGSSGGAAASVALGIVPLALGSDAGGWVRIPASFCGVVGFKPSFEVLPFEPASAITRLNCAGVLATTAEDAALGLRVLAGVQAEIASSPTIRMPAFVSMPC